MSLVLYEEPRSKDDDRLEILTMMFTRGLGGALTNALRVLNAFAANLRTLTQPEGSPRIDNMLALECLRV